MIEPPKFKLTSLHESAQWQRVSEDAELAFVEFSQADIADVIGDLFERSFGTSPPNYPAHGVCFCRFKDEILVAGYSHLSDYPRYSLGGGMCTDNRTLRRVSPAARAGIKARGGIAQVIIEACFKARAHLDAVFSYVGHPVALEIDLRSGFLQTRFPHLIVHWSHHMPSDADSLIDEVRAMGPF